jgi:acetyl esterase/lipase
MKLRKILLYALLAFGSAVLLLGLLALGIWVYFHPSVQRTNGVVYGQRGERVLTFDVVRPAHPNGLGVVLMVSGSWKSGTNSFHPWMAAPLLRRGYTVFGVYHVSQPQATVMDIVADVQRAIRCIRCRAAEFGIDGNRLGVTGGSSGGHLSLMLATRGGPGDPGAVDPVDRESSAVQAVAIFFPVTDLLNLGTSTENPGNGGPPKSYVRAFGPQSTNLPIWRVIGREMSPIYHVTTNMAPVLILHGDADTMVPLDQSERFSAEAAKFGRTVRVVVHKGGRHGWLTMIWDVRQFAEWFDQNLAGRR